MIMQIISVCFLHHSYTFIPIGDVEAHDIDLLFEEHRFEYRPFG